VILKIESCGLKNAHIDIDKTNSEYFGINGFSDLIKIIEICDIMCFSKIEPNFITLDE